MAGIYIHIPFCKKKCIYCDFFSIATLGKISQYINTVCNELSLRIKEIDNKPVTTIYIGGGTPSLLPLNQVDILVQCLKKYVDFNSVEEFTIEMNPDDISSDYINGLIDLGINRVSVGIQSFDDGELSFINRRHTAKEAINAIQILRTAGITNISIDLIYGLPGQTLESWKNTLDKAISLDVEHISAYSLSYEEGTALFRMRERGTVSECSEEDFVAMYTQLTERFHNNGYDHYEVSNFAKPEYYSRHNKAYWDNIPYLGLGVSAHSYDGNFRRYNHNNINDYIINIGKGETYYTKEIETESELYNEYIMIRLRTKWGLSIANLRVRFGNKLTDYFLKQSKPFIENGTLRYNQDNIALNESGVMVLDSLLREVFYVD